MEFVRTTGSAMPGSVRVPTCRVTRGVLRGNHGQTPALGADPRSSGDVHMLGEIIAAIIIGIIAGYLGRALLPGDDSMGFIATVIVGVVGALVGWVLFTYVLGIGDSDKFDLGGVIGAIIGTMIVLLILRAVRPGPGRRTSTRGV